jgi:hypothetical protein
MRRFLLLVALAATAVLCSTALTIGTASAHVKSYTVDCTGMTLTASSYPAGATFTIKLGSGTDSAVGTHAALELDNVAPFVDQAWSAKITSPDGDGLLDVSGTLKACDTPPTTTAPPVTTTRPPTTTTVPPTTPPVTPPVKAPAKFTG